MTAQKESPEQQPAKADLAALYRPLGLKAVAAATLMLNNKPQVAKKIA